MTRELKLVISSTEVVPNWINRVARLDRSLWGRIQKKEINYIDTLGMKAATLRRQTKPRGLHRGFTRGKCAIHYEYKECKDKNMNDIVEETT